jgi:RNA polymerase sigma factor (sigma-70 family)
MPLSVNQPLEEFRAYLECLTAVQVDPRLRINLRLRARFGWSDIINATLLEVARALECLRGMPDPDRERKLRTMPANNLEDRIRRELAKRRDPRREGSYPGLDESWGRIQGWQVDGSTPSKRLMEQERDLQLAKALAQLPERQREAIVLKWWHKWKLAQIATHLQCTIGAVAGLQARGYAKLRKLVPADLLENS